MSTNIHGTIVVPGKQHPVFDLPFWEREFPLAEDDRSEAGWIDRPCELAIREQAIRRARTTAELGPSVASDVFVWADRLDHERPWLTRIGGRPWRPEGRPWPRDEKGVPLLFLGQICFADSRDVLPCELPGDVALIFGIKQSNCIWSSALEWSPIEIETPVDYGGIPWTGEMPIAYQGVIHRTEQFTDAEIAEPVFQSLGYKDGGWNLQSIQATSIGAFANLPQGWPFDEDEGCTLIATLSSFYFGRKWPLCDVPAGLNYASADGRIFDMCGDTARDFPIGDAGCIWIYRDSAGEFHLDEACG